MKKLIMLPILLLTLCAVSLAQDPGWPRQRSTSGGKLVYYQPQVDSWTGGHKELDFPMAFSLTPAGGKEAVGVMSIHAFTDVNVDSRTALISGMSITDTHFPSLDPDASARMDRLGQELLPPPPSRPLLSG